MNTYIRFLFEFMSVFFSGIGKIIGGFIGGIIQMFNFSEYAYVIEFYRGDLKTSEWVLVVIAVIILLILLGLIIGVVYFILRKYLVFRKTQLEHESMLEEIGSLNKEVAQLVQEKEKILAMKVSQLGLKPDEEAEVLEEVDNPEGETNKNEDPALENVRFSKLYSIDKENYRNTVLAFPTKEMRDAFYENFKDLIEQCKELL